MNGSCSCCTDNDNGTNNYYLITDQVTDYELGTRNGNGGNIERISDPKWGYVGQRVSNYSQIIFSRTDSMALIRLVNRGVLPVADDTEQGMKTALSRSNIPPVIIVTPIIAMSPDRTAIVFAPGGAFTMRFPLRYNWARVGLHSTPFLC